MTARQDLDVARAALSRAKECFDDAIDAARAQVDALGEDAAAVIVEWIEAEDEANVVHAGQARDEYGKRLDYYEQSEEWRARWGAVCGRRAAAEDRMKAFARALAAAKQSESPVEQAPPLRAGP